jgi:tartrate dehydrogenase/decarboxylase/D-malate dehydrogenase
MRHHRIAAIPGDGIGAEVVAAGLEVLAALERRHGGFRLEVETLPWGSDYYARHGAMMAADGLERLRAFDAIYFGAVGDPRVPYHVSLWGLRLAICQGLDQYANVRPARLLAGVDSPLAGGDAIDWVVVRENSEGEYAGAGGRVHAGLAHEVGLDVAVFTRAGIERIMRFAFALAGQRRRRRLTMVTKSNAQRHGMVLWDEVFDQVAAEHADIDVDRMLVDAMTARMVLRPESIDVVVATNLHADILSDLAAALSGSMGLAASANLDPERRAPSMFEPVHGAAFDIAGRGVANPIGALWSAAMMLEHLGEAEAGVQLMAAVERVTGDRRVLPPDLGGSATTAQVTAAVCAALAGAND